MDQHALTLLEFAAVRAELAELCLSPAGAARLAGEPFVCDAAAHAELQGEVGALRALLEADRLPPDADLPEVADALPALAKAEVRLGLLAADAEPRGVAVDAVAERLDYQDFVAWVVAYDRSVTWS